MKGKRWFCITGMVVALCLMVPAAHAAWVDITPDMGLTVEDLGTDTTNFEISKVKVTVKNLHESFIEGAFRLLVTPAEGTVDPLNADGIQGEDGQSPTPYFDLVPADEELWDQSEEVAVEMQFTGSDPQFTLAVALNDASVTQTIFRKKISKTPEFYSGEAKISVVPIYAPMKSSKGYYYTVTELGEAELTDSLEPLADTPEVKPIVVTYLQEEEDVLFNSVPDYDFNEDGVADEGERFAHDVYAAVSFDDGATWKKSNVSRTARKSSFTLPNGVEYPGDSESQDLKVVGPYMLVTWMDTLCRSGNPWDLSKDDDLYQVAGSQGSVDYTDPHGDEDPRPDLGVRPFYCLWASRGYLDPETNTVVWMKAEQLSVGRRDAYQNFTAGIEPIFEQPPRGRHNHGLQEPVAGSGGFGVSWQEDHKGRKVGKGRGPGAGMSGACVNHKTDIWYSSIDWAAFKLIDEDFVPQSGSGDADPIGDDGGNTEYDCSKCGYVYDPLVGDPDAGIPPGTKFVDLPEDWTCPRCGSTKAEFEKESMPHALVAFVPPVRISDNAVCQDRIPEDVWGYMHDPDITDGEVAACDYTYEGGTSRQPLLWEELPDDWTCPKCGAGKETFVHTVIKTKHTGPAYCTWFKDNPRVNRDDEYVAFDDPAYTDARYCLDGQWVAADNPEQVLGDNTADFEVLYDASGEYAGVAIDGIPAVWTGEALDGNTGASRANLELVNWNGQTSAVMAYEETKGGEGSDKEAMAPEQKAGIPVMVETVAGNVIADIDAYETLYDSGDIHVVQGPYTNSMCISCHYEHRVPEERVIPAPSIEKCSANGGVWRTDVSAIWNYANYPLSDDEIPTPGDSSFITSCVKFAKDLKICTKGSTETDCDYYALPDQLPGWHSPTQDCAGCHLPYYTKDVDLDLVLDREDQCLDTPEGAVVITDKTSELYGCVDAADLDEDASEEKERHGKSVYYHHFPFTFADKDAEALKRETIRPGYKVNRVGWDYDKGQPIEGNARRVRLVVNEAPVPASQGGKDLTLGLLYKQGIGGQGAPADAMVQLFSGGFDPEHLLKKEDGSPKVWNVSASTVLQYGEPNATDPDNEEGGKTLKVVGYGWGNHNLDDYADWNPFENVFSTRLALKGDNVVTGFAYCANWAAARNAKDIYDFYVRYSPDGGDNWSRPVNVTNLKNNEETVSDCRVMLTPPTQLPWQYNQGADDWYLSDPLARQLVASDVTTDEFMFFGIGTKVNVPQPKGDSIEYEESEIFLDLSWARGTMPLAVLPRTGLTKLDRDPERLNIHMEYDPTKYNQNYDSAAGAFLDPFVLNIPKDEDIPRTTDADKTYGYELVDLPSRPNLDYGTDDGNPAPYVNEDGTFNSQGTYSLQGDDFVYNPVNINALEYSTHHWVAKGDAFQGDIQVASNPDGTKFFAVWEQELPILEDEGQNHFEGADVWFRKEFGAEVLAATTVRDLALDGDVNQDGALDWQDGRLILRNIGKTAYDSDFLWRGDYNNDLRIQGKDFAQWKRIYIKERLKQLRNKWKSR